MVDPFSPEEVDQRRARQLVLLREICIPQVTFLLHTILDTTQQTKKVPPPHPHTHTHTHTQLTHTHSVSSWLTSLPLRTINSIRCKDTNIEYLSQVYHTHTHCVCVHCRCSDSMSWSDFSPSSTSLPWPHSQIDRVNWDTPSNVVTELLYQLNSLLTHGFLFGLFFARH